MLRDIDHVQLAIPVGGITTQYNSPSASPFTYTFPATSYNFWLLLTPTGTMATGTLNLPGVGIAVDHQLIEVTTTQAVTSLTVAATGLTVTGAPTTLAANAVFRMRFDGVNQTWYIAA